jgi:hypothetical protein
VIARISKSYDEIHRLVGDWSLVKPLPTSDLVKYAKFVSPIVNWWEGAIEQNRIFEVEDGQETARRL